MKCKACNRFSFKKKLFPLSTSLFARIATSTHAIRDEQRQKCAVILSFEKWRSFACKSFKIRLCYTPWVLRKETVPSTS